jgi:uncharacterized protein (DUF433 family)
MAGASFCLVQTARAISGHHGDWFFLLLPVDSFASGVELEYNWTMTKVPRVRLQLELAARHQRLLHLLGGPMGSGGDAETTRRVLEVVENLIDRIRQGYKLAMVPDEDERPDAVPELTRALRPELHYDYLVARPHAWRRQLAFKGRRLTVGQFLCRMRTEGWTPEEAAAQFELALEAAYEALEYGERHASLIAAEDAEDARAAKAITDAAAAG